MTSPNIEFLNTASGRYLVFTNDFDIAEKLRHDGHQDQAMVQKAALLLEGRPDSHAIVDAGAHLGTFSVPLCLQTGRKVHAFEAQRHFAQLLGANYMLNSIHNAWVHNIALGGPDSPSFVEIATTDISRPGNYGAFSLDPEIFSTGSTQRIQFTGETDKVAVRKLDSFDLPPVGLLKIDVEGQELTVLQGAVETLCDNDFPPIIFECWQAEEHRELRDATIRFVADLGYDCQPDGENIVATRSV
jgi:FkbM family methyltransferase